MNLIICAVFSRNASKDKIQMKIKLLSCVESLLYAVVSKESRYNSYLKSVQIRVPIYVLVTGDAEWLTES